jgi:protocatechuate 3,4-dioxygenase alpha subunit
MIDGGGGPQGREPERAVATASQTVGPFFHFGLTADDRLGKVAPDGVSVERIHLRVQVLDGDSLPVFDGLIEIYQPDAEGRYGQPGFHGFGRLPTDANGSCTFDTVRPGAPAAPGVAQAAHIDVCLFARGLLRHLYTRIYFAGDPAIESDPILSLVAPDRRHTLIATPAGGSAWEFLIRLQGEDETVFFDI